VRQVSMGSAVQSKVCFGETRQHRSGSVKQKDQNDERIAKPGARASIVFIIVFFIILLWFGSSGQNEAQGAAHVVELRTAEVVREF